jgi:diguanylate cyclase (GGDEF)-like protein
MLDLDGFKEINDAFGHLRGDETLRHVADLLRSQMRPGDLAFRYGGDEFVLLLPGTRGEDGRAVAERIRQAVSSQCLSGGLIRPSASIGIAECPGDADDANTLLEIADRRMYADKALQKELGSAGPGPGRVRAAV